ncbi:hypothetical protein RUM43_002651 [Polyplax serrata]|uniref:Uncharacterized protein n=1 Tax=Polyplax serrata TaxID=468196 RepID=A0AAN8S2R1_POLSC
MDKAKVETLRIEQGGVGVSPKGNRTRRYEVKNSQRNEDNSTETRDGDLSRSHQTTERKRQKDK